MEKIKVIYEDGDVLAIDKPAGLLVHGPDSLVDWLKEKYPEIKKVGDDPERPGIVHRLDKDTSGVLLAAKNQKTFEYLKSQFRDRKIKKKYLALVHGNVKNDSGVIDLPIAKSKSDFRKRAAVGKTIGKEREAVTEYLVKKRFKDFTLVEAYPQTGRTHQIRVHFKAIGHPIAGDRLYGPQKRINSLGLKRHFLHAAFLDFVLQNGSRVRFEADLPDDLQKALNMLHC
jgi:23S rRNA pseudouridine1911/1915/1917 synthase